MMVRTVFGLPGLIIGWLRSDFIFKRSMALATAYKVRQGVWSRTSSTSLLDHNWSRLEPANPPLYGPIDPKRDSGLSFGPSSNSPRPSNRFDIIIVDAYHSRCFI